MKFAPTTLAVLAMASSAPAQVPAWSASGEAAGHQFAKTLVVTGDLDGDGVGDVLVGAPRASFAGGSSGSVYALSGASGAELYRIDGAAGSELFGGALARIADVTGDGIDDWIVGASNASQGVARNGRVELRSGVDGGFVYALWGQEQFGYLGTAVAALGDTNGDGRADFLVSAPLVDSNGQDAGTVFLHSGLDGGLLRVHDGAAAGDSIGQGLVGLGDVSGDGLADYAIGAPFSNGGLGYVEAFSGATGTSLRVLSSTGVMGQIGFALARVTDRNGDTRDELAIGAPQDAFAAAGAGSVLIWDVASGGFPQSVFGQAGDELGTSVTELGDWNGDLTTDLLIGLAGGAGSARVYSGAGAGAAILATVAPEGTSGQLGAAVAGGFDVDGDGQHEILVGDPSDDGGGNDAGLVRAFSEHSLLGQALCFGDGTGTVCPCGNFGGLGEGCANSGGAGGVLEATGTPSVTQDDIRVFATGLRPGQSALLFVGATEVAGGSGTLFGDGLRCAGGQIQRLGVRSPDAQGAADWGPGLASQYGWSAGQTRVLQTWYRDTVASPCGTGFNLTSAFRIDLQP